jgi:hypothetical protein
MLLVHVSDIMDTINQPISYISFMSVIIFYSLNILWITFSLQPEPRQYPTNPSSTNVCQMQRYWRDPEGKSKNCKSKSKRYTLPKVCVVLHLQLNCSVLNINILNFFVIMKWSGNVGHYFRGISPLISHLSIPWSFFHILLRLWGVTLHVR